MTTAPAPLLRRDVRRLGRILGDVVRTQHGAAAFALIECIRRLSTGRLRSDDPALRGLRNSG